MSALRVLDVNNNYSPTGGGIRTYHDRKRVWFRDAGVPNALVVPSDRWERTADGPAITYHVPALPLGGSGYRFVVRRKHLARVVEDFQPSLIEVGSPFVVPKLLAGLDHGAATVGFYHSDVPDTIVGPALRRIGVRPAKAGTAAASRWMGNTYGAMTAMFGASVFVLDKLADAGVRRLFHTPLGVDTDVHTPAARDLEWRRSLGVADDDTLVLYLARVAPEKGIRRLFDAYPHFRRDGLRVLVVGHGPLQRELDTFVGRYPEVLRLGYMSERADVARAYASADVALSLGDLETFSLATTEALASGTPTVAPRAGGAGEQVAALTPELVFEADDPASLAEAVVRAASFTEAQRAALRTGVVSRFDWSEVFKRERAHYERIVAAHRTGDLDSLLPPDGRWHAA